MNWIAVTWGACAGICLALAGLQLLVWVRDRTLWANFWFSLSALSASATAIIELALMHAESADETGFWIRWMHASVTVCVVALIWFIRAYLGAGSLWLAWISVGLRTLTLVVNFLPARANVLFREMNAPHRVEAWGEVISVPAGVGTEWTTLVTVTSILFLIYLLGAVVAAWRQGNRRRAVVLGVALLGAFLLGMTQTRLVAAGLLSVPYTMSLLFLLAVSAIGCELGMDLVRAKQAEMELRQSRERLNLAAGAAELGVWDWDILRDEIYASAPVRERLGLDSTEPLDFNRYLQLVCPEDRESIRRAVGCALDGAGEFEAEYRLTTADGVTRWIAARGRVERDRNGRPQNLRGISIDISNRKEVEAESQRLRHDLAHVSRTSTLNELSGSLAHELSQPLGVILSNAQAAQELIAQNPNVPGEVGEILSDIVSADRRAADVIQQMRAMLRRGEIACTPLALNQLIEEVLTLARADLIIRGVTVVTQLSPDLPRIPGDRVQIQQVVLNLLLNAADAMAGSPRSARHLSITTRLQGDRVRVSVRDEGHGLPADVESLFKPFFTTKDHGLGLGLAICRSIIDAHQGRLWAEPHPERGAVFHIELRAVGTPSNP